MTRIINQTVNLHTCIAIPMTDSERHEKICKLKFGAAAICADKQVKHMVNVLCFLTVIMNHLIIEHNIMKPFEGILSPQAKLLPIPIARVNPQCIGQRKSPSFAKRLIEYISYWIPEMDLPAISVAFIVGCNSFRVS